MAPFDHLLAFQKAYALGLAVVRSAERWPKQHQYGLASQARRASTSVSINLAEGACKRGRAEFRRYLDIALGSLAETEVLLRFACDLRFLSDSEYQELESKREETGKVLWSLYKSTAEGRGRPFSRPMPTPP